MVLFRKKAEASDSDRILQLMIVHGNADTGDITGKIFDLQCGNNVMGRDPLCEIRFKSGTVSRKHANLKVSYNKKTFTIIDLGSSNGIIIKPKTHLKKGKKTIPQKLKKTDPLQKSCQDPKDYMSQGYKDSRSRVKYLLNLQKNT